jgi:hypothetical protein
MAAQQGREFSFDLGPLAEYLKKTGRKQEVKTFLETYGVKRIVEIIGVDRLWELMSPEQRAVILRLGSQHESGRRSEEHESRDSR